MRTYTLITRSIVILSAFAAACADAPNVTSPDNPRLGALRPTCVKSNVGGVSCSSPTSSLRPSAAFYEHEVQGQGYSYAQPNIDYLYATTKIDIGGLTPGVWYTSISDGVQTVSFPSLQRLQVPTSYDTWSSPPESESATPSVLYSDATLFTPLTLSQPAAVVGFEVEPDPLVGEYEVMAEYYDATYTLLGVVRRTVNGNAGARLFSFSPVAPRMISRVDVSVQGYHFAIAQFRYGFTHVTPPPSTIALSIDIKPGTVPNDVNRSGKGRLPVAVLTTPTFDAATIDVASVTLGDEAAQDTPVAQQNKGTAMAALQDVDGDGDLDLILQFDIPTLVANGDLGASTTQLVLKGNLIGGNAVRGADNVTVKP